MQWEALLPVILLNEIKKFGVDRFTPPHSMGSSHGQTRIIREACFQGPQYVPIIQQSYSNWEKSEKDYGQQLYLQKGGLMMGAPDCEIVNGAKRSADLHHLPYEALNTYRLIASQKASFDLSLFEKSL